MEGISKVGSYIFSPPPLFFKGWGGGILVFKTQKGVQDIKMRRVVVAEGTSKIKKEGGLNHCMYKFRKSLFFFKKCCNFILDSGLTCFHRSFFCSWLMLV